MYPELFKIGSFTVRTYSVMLLIAFIVGILLVRRYIKRRTLIDPAVATDLAFWVIIGVVIGARLAYAFMNWKLFKDDPIRVLYIWEGGAAYFGGFVLAFLFGGIFLWRKKIPALPLMDAIAPAVAMGEGIGRIGCFLNGCCFGQPTGAFCGVTFPEHSFASAVYGPGHSIWPTQLFQSGGGFLLFVILLLLMRFVRLRKGQLFGVFLTIFAAFRFGVNLLRHYDDSVNYWTNQIVALVLVALGIALFIYSSLTQEKVPTPEWIAAERKKIEEARKKKEKRYKKSAK